MFKKIFDSKPFKWVRYIRQQLQNQRQNRQLIGQDRDGNKYYQYYSYWGLPTRREIRWKIQGDWDMKDLVYYQWLHHQQFDPPTQSEKQQFYLQQKQRYEKALEWDKKEEMLLEQFRKKKEELALRDMAMAQLQKELLTQSQLTNIKTKRTVQSSPLSPENKEQKKQENKEESKN